VGLKTLQRKHLRISRKRVYGLKRSWEHEPMERKRFQMMAESSK